MGQQSIDFNLGVGVGLRRQHFDDVMKSTLDVDWFEVVSENFMDFGGKPKFILDQLKAKMPIIPHGLGLSLGDPYYEDKNYLADLKNFLLELKPIFFSDHLCISSINGKYYHDLIPILRTKESLRLICDKIKRIQDYFEIPFAVENISYYTNTDLHTISETDFISQLIDQTGCYLLLDVNNVYVNSLNFKFDALTYISNLPLKNVIQIHLAGHDAHSIPVIDTHGALVDDAVWKLYADTIKLIGHEVSTLIEWDHQIPSFEQLNQQVLITKQLIADLKHDL